MNDLPTFANPAVLEFYRTLPFNIRDSVEESVDAIRRTDHATAYPVLAPLFKAGMRVLDVGCGTGWFANSLAYHHGVMATGLDFNPVAIDRAREVAAALQLPTSFAVGDLFRFEPIEPFDLVVSLGVLHHTDNCLSALRRVCDRFVRPGGHALIGLYHRYGRQPLLDHFRAMRERGATEQEMLDRYRQLHAQITDETLLLSWFRDQVLHPHETQHTLEEVVPILESSGMELVSTSINKFQPIESLPALYAAERAYYDLGVRRLEENRYFTGFFVFLAHKPSSIVPTGTATHVAEPTLVNAKPYVEHHPIFGYSYIPDTSLELPRPDGGHYHLQVNSQGIRSDREYTFVKPAGTRRIIVCGDSMAAGQFIDNANRFSELLERRLPKLEVINLALEGSGTDQQLLLYEHFGLKYEHDLVVLLPFLQNIRRNLVDAREGIDPKTGQTVLRPKPRFELVAGQLVLRNVPVPLAPPADAGAPTMTNDTERSPIARLKTRVSALPGARFLKQALYSLVPWEPFPEYRDPNSDPWRLITAIIHRFKELAGNRPLVLAPTFYSNYVRFRMARNYWDRFASLTMTPGIHAVDLLPHFQRLGRDAVRCFQDPYDMHLSAYGNLVLADVLEKELRKSNLL